MEITIPTPTKVNVKYVCIVIPLRYDDEHSMPKVFPCREGKHFSISVDIDTGKIQNWPSDAMGFYTVNEKVVDTGAYSLNTEDGKKIAEIVEDYVPNRLIPGEYGDYIELEIMDGVITNWPKNLTQESLAAFFPKSDED